MVVDDRHRRVSCLPTIRATASTGTAETMVMSSRLEQQGEAAVGPRPRHAGLLDAASVAAHAGVQIRLVLEES